MPNHGRLSLKMLSGTTGPPHQVGVGHLEQRTCHFDRVDGGSDLPTFKRVPQILVDRVNA